MITHMYINNNTHDDNLHVHSIYVQSVVCTTSSLRPHQADKLYLEDNVKTTCKWHTGSR